MSFSASVKQDLSKTISENPGVLRAELSGMLGSAAGLNPLSTDCLELRTSTPAVAGRIYKMIKHLYGVSVGKEVKKQTKFKTHRDYHLRICEKTSEIIKDLRLKPDADGVTIPAQSGIPGRFGAKQEFVRAYIRGVFLMCGSIANPERNYHLELLSKSENYLKSVQNILLQYEIKSSLIQRKSMTVLYLKESESITGFLNVIGATKALLDMENIRIIKEMRGEVNRQVNCETANLEKTATAANRQLAAIRKIKNTTGLDALPSGLRDVALLRLENPDMTTQELGEQLTPMVSKSGVYHRLKKIVDIAEKN